MLNRILVPTDFSPCASYAGDLAIAIAAQAKSSVHFFHSAQAHPFWDELSEQERNQFPETFAEMHQMERRFSEVLEAHKGKGVGMETSYSAGNLLQTVRKLIDKEAIDLMVMGSHGASGLQEIVFGSNAQRLVRHAHCPVMVIKDEVPSSFSRIVFASDFGEAAIPAFDWMVKFAKLFDAELMLLHIMPEAHYGGKQLAPPPSFEPFMERADGAKVSIQSYTDLDIETGINNFVDRSKADLVAMAHYHRPMLERILVGSLTEALINHMSVPVMSINVAK
ncbi:MAG: universal stress protein [Bacteroidia bacterium]